MTSLSLVVCTHDHADRLGRLLASVDAALRPDGFELVLVDNGSSDSTAEVIATHPRRSLYRVVPVNEPRAGLGRARNRGAASASGELLAMTDDDCLLPTTHLLETGAAFDALPIDYAGGRVLEAGPGDVPSGLLADATFRYVPRGSVLRPGQVQGANLVVRAHALAAVGGFDERMGAGTPFRCEDIDLVARLSAAGFVGAHLPQLVVRHDHGRDRAAARRVDQANDGARGAFWATRLAGGDDRYALDWARLAVARLAAPRTSGGAPPPRPGQLRWAVATAVRELAGAKAWRAATTRPLALAGPSSGPPSTGAAGGPSSTGTAGGPAAGSPASLRTRASTL